MNNKLTLITILLIFSLQPLLLYPKNLKDVTINIVEDIIEWPPFLYYERENGIKSKKTVGYSIDIIQQIFKKHNIKFTISFFPWKRSLQYVKEGKDYQLILNASYSKKRYETYLMSDSYYSLTPVVFYSSKKYPNSITVRNIDDLKKNFRICGLLGYSYNSIGLKDNEVDKTSIYNYDKLIDLLHNRQERCDVFVQGYEVISGFMQIGKNYLADPHLKYMELIELKNRDFHMLISKNFKYGSELQKLINRELLYLKNNGTMNSLKRKYNLLLLKEKH